METQPTLQISIPKPCHEDWNKFTPDEKGAFCKVCSKSVHDFTKKTVEEINTILVEEISAGKKVCGRFNEDQLDRTATPALKGNAELPLDPYSLNFQRVKKFALALFLVFGGYLFSTPKTYAQKMGKVAYIPRPEPVKGEISPRYVEPVEPVVKPVPVEDSVKVATPKINKCSPLMLKGDVAVERIERRVMGGVSAVRIEEPVVKITELGQVAIKEAPEKLVIKFTPPEVTEDTLVVEALPEPEILVEENFITGLVAMPYIEVPPILIDPIPSDSLMNEVDGEFAVVESTEVEKETPLAPELKKAEEITLPENALEINVPKMECYPNPSTGFINVKYNVKENVQTSIVLYDMKGNVVKTLVAPQNMYAADYSSRFDISELPDGLYFCTMQSGDKTSTQRVILGR